MVVGTAVLAEEAVEHARLEDPLEVLVLELWLRQLRQPI